jgi:hypothetical protein
MLQDSVDFKSIGTITFLVANQTVKLTILLSVFICTNVLSIKNIYNILKKVFSALS